MLATFAFGLSLIGARIVAMMLAAPMLGNKVVPVHTRVILAILISLAAAPLIFTEAETVQFVGGLSAADWIGAVFSEGIIGGLIGLGVLIIFSSAQMIGSAIGQMSGIQMDSFTNSDSGFGQFPTTQLIGIVAAAVYVLLGGPDLVISAVLDSFQRVPLGQQLGSGPAIELLVTLLNQSFDLTVRAIAPATATVVASTLLVGLITKTLPQLNMIQLGLSSNVAIMLLAIFLTLGGCIWLVADNIEGSLAVIRQSLQSLSFRGG